MIKEADIEIEYKDNTYHSTLYLHTILWGCKYKVDKIETHSLPNVLLSRIYTKNRSNYYTLIGILIANKYNITSYIY